MTLLPKCERCGKEKTLDKLSLWCRGHSTHITVCDSCLTIIIDYIRNPPRYCVVVLNAMQNRWVPEVKMLTETEARERVLQISGAYRVYDFSMHNQRQQEWWNENQWALRDAQGRQGKL